MATTLTSPFDNQIYAYTFRGTAACSATGDRYLALTTDEAGTEVTGGGYARQNLTSALPANPTAGDAVSTGALSFTSMPACTVFGVKVMTAVSAGSEIARAPLAFSRSVAGGATFTLAAGDLTALVDGKT